MRLSYNPPPKKKKNQRIYLQIVFIDQYNKSVCQEISSVLILYNLDFKDSARIFK